MKKRILALVLATAMIFSVVGCGKKKDKDEATGASVQEEIVKLVNEDLPGIAADRDNAVSIYNDYFKDSSSQDSESWKTKLESEALTSYDTYLANLDALTYENAEVQNLKDLFAKSASSQRDAIQYVVDAITDLDSTKLDDASQSIKDSKTYLQMYEDELERLCDEYGITINGEFQSPSLVDASVTDASSSDASSVGLNRHSRKKNSVFINSSSDKLSIFIFSKIELFSYM